MHRVFRSFASAGVVMLLTAGVCLAATAPPESARTSGFEIEIGGSNIELCGQVTAYLAPDGTTTNGSLTMVGVLQPDPHQFTIAADASLSAADSDRLAALAATDSFTCLRWDADGLGVITKLAIPPSVELCGTVDQLAGTWRLTLSDWGGDVTGRLTAEAAAIVAGDAQLGDLLRLAEQSGVLTCVAFVIGPDAVVDVISGRTFFTDVATSQFYYEILWIFRSDITSGCAPLRYCPGDNVRRDQMASFLDRALDLPPTAIDYFDDDDGNIHEAAINRLAAAGITGGCDTRRYCPGDYVRRDQMASFLDRALDLPLSSSDYFHDDDGNIHEAAINRLAYSHVTQGCAANHFCPSQLVTRGQMAAFLKRGLTYPFPPDDPCPLEC